MFSKIKEFLFGKKPESVSSDAPYKLEPVVEQAQSSATIACGCGRSPSGFCVGFHNLSNEEWAVHPENKSLSAPVVSAPVVAPVAAPVVTPVKKKTRAPAKKVVKTEPVSKTTKSVKPKAASSGPAAIKAKKATRKKSST
jgi:hypothetical protein